MSGYRPRSTLTRVERIARKLDDIMEQVQWCIEDPAAWRARIIRRELTEQLGALTDLIMILKEEENPTHGEPA